ncbi:hypothetical protein LQZ18_12010 [Lachnospiraceae bacterium ZAX-1]
MCGHLPAYVGGRRSSDFDIAILLTSTCGTLWGKRSSCCGIAVLASTCVRFGKSEVAIVACYVGVYLRTLWGKRSSRMSHSVAKVIYLYRLGK